MAKRKVKKASFICLLAFAVMCVLTVLNFALPLLHTKTSASVIGIGTSTENDYGLFDLLDGMSDKDAADKSDKGLSASVAFFADEEKTQAKWFTILTLITAIVAALGIVVAVIGLVMPKIGGYVKYIGVIIALLAITTFIFAIVTTSAFTSSVGSSSTGASFTVSLAVGSILSLVGGIGAAVVPFVLKR